MAGTTESVSSRTPSTDVQIVRPAGVLVTMASSGSTRWPAENAASSSMSRERSKSTSALSDTGAVSWRSPEIASSNGEPPRPTATARFTIVSKSNFRSSRA